MHAFFMPHSLGQIAMRLWIGLILDTRLLVLISQLPTNFLLLFWRTPFPNLQSLSSRIVSNDCILHAIIYDFIYYKPSLKFLPV
jgi:hypothetical protein